VQVLQRYERMARGVSETEEYTEEEIESTTMDPRLQEILRKIEQERKKAKKEKKNKKKLNSLKILEHDENDL
jgi:hypothetical protein